MLFWNVLVNLSFYQLHYDVMISTVQNEYFCPHSIFNIYFVLCKVFLINSGHALQRCYVEDDFTKPQDLIKIFLVDG